MGITITNETIDSSWANGEQADGGVLISITATWKADVEEEQDFTKADFERDLQKVSRKVKK